MLRQPLAYVNRYRESSGLVRFHQYSRFALYSFPVTEGFLIATWAQAMPDTTEMWIRVVVLLVGAAHLWLLLWLVREGLRCYLGEVPRPSRLLHATLSMTLLGTALALLLLAAGRLPEDAALVLAWFPMYFAGPAMMVLPIRQGVAVTAVPVAVAVLSAWSLGLDSGNLARVCLLAVAGSLVMGGSCRATAWSLRVVEELNEGRETQARLAVAEERLRFGRDMHDVLGRNLSVIALKSELAVQLAQRGAAGPAADQMTEVQRIARESQQEMRAVLRGYREADLNAEIAGARGVLEAAGIRCVVDADPETSDALPLPVRTALGWVVREGATNVLRHSDATTCTLRLRRDPADQIELTVRNDGVVAAAAPDPATPAGTGLSGLRERLASVSGTLTARTAPEKTFLLTARIPRQPTERESEG